MAWMAIAQGIKSLTAEKDRSVNFAPKNNAQDKLDAMQRRQEAMATENPTEAIDKAINAAQTGLPPGDTQNQVLQQLEQARKADELRRRNATPAPTQSTRME